MSKIKPHFDAIDYFKELPFNNKPIEKAKVKHLKNIDRLAELPFYKQLSVIITDKSFRGYAYKVEITEKKDPIVEVEESKSSIKEYFSDCLMKQKYLIPVKKYKLNREIEFAPVYFISVTKAVINHRFRIENYFQEILCMIDVWINNGSG